MEDLSFSFRHAARRLVRTPQHTLLIVLCLALGIGANTAIFSIVNNMLLRPAPVPDIDEVGMILDMREGTDPFDATQAGYLILRDEATSFESVGVMIISQVNLTGGDQPERVQVANVTHDYMKTVGIKPIYGRLITAQDDVPGGPDVLLLGHALWQRRFGGDPKVVGQTLQIDNRSYTIVGILPRNYDLPGGTQIWLPLRADFAALPVPDLLVNNYLLLTRLKPGVAFDQAAKEVEALGVRLEQRYPDRKGWVMRMLPLRYQILNDFEGTTGRSLYLILSVVGFLLLIACANVASLLLVRVVERSQELALQSALGANRRRLFGPLIAEGLLLSFLGGAGGLLLAWLSLPLLSYLMPHNFLTFRDFFSEVPLDRRVLLYTFGITLATGLVFSILPVVRVAASNRLNQFLSGGNRRATTGRAGRRFLTALVIGEVAVAMILLVGASLMIRSFQRHLHTDLGYDLPNRHVFEIYLSEEQYSEHPLRIAYVTEVLERVRALPGVIHAGFSTDLPLNSGTVDTRYDLADRPEPDFGKLPITAHRRVTGGYLQALNMRLVAGRLITDRDRVDSQRVVVVSRDFAEREWPGENPIGKQIRQIRRGEAQPWMTVVGVVKPVKEARDQFYIDRQAWYLPYAQHPNTAGLWLIVHADGPANQLVEAVRREVKAVDPLHAVARVTSMEEHLFNYFRQQRFTAYLTGLFAFLGLLLAAMGLYGLLSYAVAQQVQEIGVRIAVGAKPADLLRMVVGNGMLMALGGVLLGWLGAALLTRFFAKLLWQVDPFDSLAYGATAAILLAVALIATLVPAMRTLGKAPLLALRES
jgi:putative ABC transport system permease protein